MSRHFHPLTIKEIRRETNDCISLAFEVPEALRQTFQFTQGQSLTLRTTIDKQEIRRTYSLCSSPLENEWRVAVKLLEGGIFSGYAHQQLRAGDVLEVMPPVGKFNTPLQAEQQKHYLAFAAGSGITPILSLLKTTLAIEPKSHFTLVYGNRDRQSILFFEALEGLKNLYMERFQLLYLLSRERTESPLNAGKIDAAKLALLSTLYPLEHMDEIFICGPEAMLFTVKEFLENKGIASHKIHFELFTTPGQSQAYQPNRLQPAAATATGSQVTVKLDGRSFDFEIPSGSHSTLLDAALATGADLPYACKGGVCCTCKAKLLEGEVEMEVHWGLEEEEIKQGYILSCQSHPKSARVVIDFDIK